MDYTETMKMCFTILRRCQDYVELKRDTFGSSEVCGNETSMNGVLELDFGSYTVIFRSSEVVRGEGFEMYSICFKPEERDWPGMCIINYYNSYSTSSVLYGLTRPCHEYQYCAYSMYLLCSKYITCSNLFWLSFRPVKLLYRSHIPH